MYVTADIIPKSLLVPYITADFIPIYLWLQYITEEFTKVLRYHTFQAGTSSNICIDNTKISSNKVPKKKGAVCHIFDLICTSA